MFNNILILCSGNIIPHRLIGKTQAFGTCYRGSNPRVVALPHSSMVKHNILTVVDAGSTPVAEAMYVV